MKRLTTSRIRKARTRLGLAAAAIALAAPLSAGAASSLSSGRARVVGSGVRAPSTAKDVPFTFSVDAKAPARPDGVYGTFSGSFPHDPFFRHGHSAPGNFATFAGVVTCLRVSGITATIGGVVTRGYGYDGTYSGQQRDLTGDWFITIAQDPKGPKSTDTMGYTDWGDRAYFTNPANFGGHHFGSFRSLCNDPTPDLGKSQFPLRSGDITIKGE